MLKSIYHLLLGGVKPKVIAHLRIMGFAKSRNYWPLARFIEARMQVRFGIFISHKAQLGKIVLKHPVGLVIGEGVTLEDNVTLYQHVTLGGRRIGDSRQDKYPFVSEGAVIYAGAVVLGDVFIGKNAVVGANAVVLSDVPDGATVAGVPAKVLGRS